MKITRLFCSFFIASFFLISCQSEPAPLNNTNCKLSRGYIYELGTGVLSDSAEYIYTGDKITKVKLNTEHYFTLEYNNDKIIKRSFFSSVTNASEGYDLVSYNANGTFNKVERYDAGITPHRLKTIDFHYTSGKVSGLTFSDDDGAGNLERKLEMTYTYTGNNITGLTSQFYSLGQLDQTKTGTLVYDTKPNYFQKQNPQFILTDPFFIEFDRGFIQFVLSENNIISVINANEVVNYSYAADSYGNLISLSEDGDIGLRYTYLCP